MISHRNWGASPQAICKRTPAMEMAESKNVIRPGNPTQAVLQVLPAFRIF
jgi:hypothetical protein